MERGQIYTWIGTLLLALNPTGVEIPSSTDHSNTYDLAQSAKYNDVCNLTYKEVTPHIYAVASRAHYRIVHGLGKPGQMIVLNGETGAGKTFNARKALDFLTIGIAPKLSVIRDILQKVTDACRLISAFTTAPTEKNDASSRHVQLVWLEYKMGNICGATISSYLLEKSRVTKSSCNFHIFSQMRTALTENGEFANLRLTENETYFTLNDTDLVKRQQLHDDFCKTLSSMDTLGFTADEKINVFQVLFLIVHMSNIQFVRTNDQCRIDTDNEQSREAVENTCRLTCLEKDDVDQLLTSILIRARSTSHPCAACRRNLDTEDACRYRLRSIIHHVYELLFQWLISSVNKTLSAGLHSERLGILDIFGFECFNANGIEQLCVNYVNERVQQHFVKKYLESCREDLEREGLIDREEPSEIVKLYDDRLNTIEKHLFAPLNDICLSTFSSDSSMLLRDIAAQTCLSTKRFLYTRNENFAIRHYASIVEYSASDVLSKNIDKEEDMYIIRHGACTLFYKNRILSRRRPSTFPIRIHTRPTCLSNSHYAPHTEPPQGLQELKDLYNE